MKKMVLSGLALCAAVIAAGAANFGQAEAEPPAPYTQPAPEMLIEVLPGVPAHAMPPLGQCRIWYDELPADVQPARMECEHAQWLAQRWGGRVISQDHTGAVELARFEGRNDFRGVPVEALPQHGHCRAWIEGAPLAQQPQESDCRTARRTAEAAGGRVLYMPL